MTFPRLTLGAFAPFCLAGAFALMVLPAAAHAGDAQCLWDHTEKANRDAFFAAYPQQGPNAAMLLTGKDQAKAMAIPRACGVPAAKDYVAGKALTYFAVRTASSVVLKGRFKIEPHRLRALYEAIPAADRARMGRIVTAGKRSADDQAFLKTTFQACAKKLGLTDPVGVQQLVVYLTASAALDWAQPQF